MDLKKIKLHFVLIIISTIFCTNIAYAAVPAHITDHGSYLTDNLSGLDWLDITPTINQSYDFVSSQFGNNGLYKGWRYASSNELYTLVINFAPNDITNDNAIRTDFEFGSIRPLIQMLGASFEADPSGGAVQLSLASLGIISKVNNTSPINSFCDISGYHCRSTIASYDYVQHFDFYSNSNLELLDDTESNQLSGSFLVRQSSVDPVPVPVSIAVWLLIGWLE